MRPPFSPAAERNRQPILEVLREQLAPESRVLEIGSGTGQHACWCTSRLPLRWQASETPDGLAMLIAGLGDRAGQDGLAVPLELDVLRSAWPPRPFDAVFSANTAHIMGWSAVRAMLRGVAGVLERGGIFVLYGPFRRDGEHTSASNREFDRQLRSRDESMGIRDLGELDAEAARHGLQRRAEYAMPANNLCLIWHRVA